MRKILLYSSTIIFLLVALIIDFDQHKWKTNQVFHYDSFGYHNYLPALFIYQDISEYNFLDSINVKYKPTNGEWDKYGLYKANATGKLCNQYPLGVAIFQMPLFFVAHAWASITHQHPADGYSSPYQHATVFSSLIFVVLGLFLLASFLQNYFSASIVALTILLVGFGTNLFQYATLDSGLSHPYLFFLYCAILYLTEKWYRHAKSKYSILLGICIGLCAICRPVDILVCLIPLLWKSGQIDKVEYFKTNWKQLVLAVVFVFIATTPQLIYWKYVTDQWLYYSYSSADYFEFDRFRVVHGLFGYRKGWFVYTPIALIGFISMLLFSKQSKFRFYALPFWSFFLPMIYIVFSWHCWFYGWGFGCRALLQALPLLAIPLAIVLEKIRDSKNLIRYSSVTLLALLISLNLFQTWQYNKGILHGSSVSETFYWRVFLKTQYDPKNDKAIQLQNELDAEYGL